MGFDIDFTELQRRGILKRAEEREENIIKGANYTKDGFVDLGSFGAVKRDEGEEKKGETEKLNDAEISNIKVQIDNLEYKFERILERISALEVFLRDKSG